MNIRRIQELLKSKEGIRLEFKEAKRDLPNNLFDSVCAMLNRDGATTSIKTHKIGHKKSTYIIVSAFFCGSNRIRTCDPLLVRQML